MELFNWNKPGFPPRGLLNCGNRFVLKWYLYFKVILYFLRMFYKKKELDCVNPLFLSIQIKPQCSILFLFLCSCFANVVLQCLAYTRPLVAYLLEKGHRRECMQIITISRV